MRPLPTRFRSHPEGFSMSRRPLAPLLDLCALLAVGLLGLVGTVGPEAATRVERAGPAAATPASDARAAPALQPSLPDAPIETAPATPAREEVASASKSLAPEDAVWFEGRVQLPDGTPADEHVEVMALGDGRDWDKAERTPLAADGSFPVAVAKTAKRASIDLASRYVYLAAPLSIAPPTQPKDAPPIVP